MKRTAQIIFPGIVILASFAIALLNYTPGTILTGWDALHSEFDFGLSIQKMFFGVWREDHGLGAIAAHSHMADFPRVIFLWLLSLVFDLNLLRYLFVFFCLLLGSFGMYQFLKYVFERDHNSFWVYPASCLGALFYLLNLTTLQNFYLPFEMFTTAYALMPWIFGSGLRYLREGGKSNYVVMAAIIILASPMAYAATLWYASFAGFFIFLAAYILFTTSKRVKLRRLILSLEGIVLLNLYWILPNIYSLVNQSKIISQSHINRLFSPEAFLRNVDFGTLSNILIQKNFLFAWRNYDFRADSFRNLLEVWNVHLSSPWVQLTGYGLAALFVTGIVASVFKKEKVGLAFIPVILFASFFLLNANPPFGQFYSYLYDRVGLFREGFRMPFTKFSILFSLSASFFFGYFVFFVLSIKNHYLRPLKSAFIVVLVTGLIYFALPVFSGELIGKNVRGNLPKEYFDIYKFLGEQGGRVAKLPMHTKFNWEYHDWVYEGSGWFTWFLSSNPLLDRDFDRWSKYNENFYLEASHAINSGNLSLLEKVLEKYSVRYLLLDESIINPDAELSTMHYGELRALLSAGSKINEIRRTDALTVYEFTPGPSYVGTFNLSIPVKTVPEGSNIDPIYDEVGPYYNDPQGLIYPFVNLGAQREVDIYESEQGLVIENTDEGDGIIFPVDKKISEDLRVERGFSEAYNCDFEKLGTVEKIRKGSLVEYSAMGSGVSCDYLGYPDLTYKNAYVMRVRGQNLEGRSLKIYFYNMSTERMEVEELLPKGEFDEYFMIYPKQMEGKGYVLNFETRSYGRVSSRNILKGVEFYPLDWNYLKSYKSKNSPEFKSARSQLKVKNVYKYGSWAYKTDVQGYGLLYLSQGFENGWVALAVPEGCRIFDLRCKELLAHTTVNSWANGWVVPKNNSEGITIYIFFWPQLLEWAGMVLGIVTVGLILSKKPLQA